MNRAQANSVHEEESPFHFNELFFSHTSKKGEICYGNDVFARVSEYEMEEMIGRPHNIIRHPDMPRAVFKLFWNKILKNEIIAAYVKNKSKNGRYYWVFAIAFPFKEGFLSIRIKPGSEIFDLVPGLYQKVLDVESKEGLKKSCEFLDALLKEKGFPTYEEFMIQAMAKERIQRIDILGDVEEEAKKGLKNNSLLREIHFLCGRFERESKEFSREFEKLKFLCINMLAHLEKCGREGAAMAVIAGSFEKWGEEIQRILSLFMQKQESFMENNKKAWLCFNVAWMQKEMSSFFNRSKNTSKDYMVFLDELANENLNKCHESFSDLMRAFHEFSASAKGLRSSLTALKVIKISSNVESAYLGEKKDIVLSTVEEISEFVNFVDAKSFWFEKEVKKLQGLVVELKLC